MSNNLLDLVCMNFTKIGHSKDSKEYVLVITDAVSKLMIATTTSNQKSHTVAKALVDKWL